MKITDNKFNQNLDWSGFMSNAQSNFVFSRLALKSNSPWFGATSAHQMIELSCKAFILHSVYNQDYSQYKKIIYKYGHNTPELIKDFAQHVEVFDILLNNKEYWEFINEVHDRYIDSRYGQTIMQVYLGKDIKALDEIFLVLTKYFYNLSNIDSFLFLSIPRGTEPFFHDANFLNFNFETCGIFGNCIGNIQIII